MSPPSDRQLTAACACGRVVIEASGTPITTLVCYCDNCQEGGRRIEALPHAPAVLEVDGGSAYVVYRKDRLRCTSGSDLLRPQRIRADSVTNRVLATCCNSAMYLNFDDGKHWVDIYRSRVRGEAPPLQFRVCTRFRPDPGSAARDMPSFPGYPTRLLVPLLTARLAMLLGR
jgi:hypothetical protein